MVYRDPGAECYTTPVSATELEVALLKAVEPATDAKRLAALLGRDQ